MSNAALIKLTITALIGVGLLVWLGVWQLERHTWKERIIQRIEDRTARKPVSLDRAIELARELQNPSYLPVRAEGRFHHEKERYLYSIALDGKPGWHVITPLETVSGRVVLVDRGFVPQELRDPSARAQGQFKDVVSVTGLVRTPEQPGLFSPDNDLEANQWFTRDLGAMTNSMFPGATVEPVPFFLEAVKSDIPGGWPMGGQTRLHLARNHLQYAFTWFALAIVLIVIYVAFVWEARRGKRP